MEQTCYKIEHHRRQWTISVGNAPVLVCTHKRVAMQTIAGATGLLLNQPVTLQNFLSNGCGPQQADDVTEFDRSGVPTIRAALA
jgi:hypothetical protein